MPKVGPSLGLDGSVTSVTPYVEGADGSPPAAILIRPVQAWNKIPSPPPSSLQLPDRSSN
ncbi:hypothetical protein Bpfe_028297, partial [Biomphalaria pfeifferi]